MLIIYNIKLLLIYNNVKYSMQICKDTLYPSHLTNIKVPDLILLSCMAGLVQVFCLPVS